MRYETKHSMLRRCIGWDYRQPCIYQITLVLADRRSQALGRLVIDRGLPPAAQDGMDRGLPPAAQDKSCSVPGAEALGVMAHVELSAAGEAVLSEWKRIGEHHPEIRPLFMQVMPDHVHGILQVMRPMAKPLGIAIGGFKTGSSKAAIGRPGLWAEGFQDTILFHEGQLDAMFHYLRDNPRRLAVKRLMPEIFQVQRDFVINLELPLQAQDKTELPLQAQDNLQPQSEIICAHFAAIGNQFLLRAPMILQVQCSRADFAYSRIAKAGVSNASKIERNAKGEPVIAKTTPQFEEKRDVLLAAARHGAVLVSPCISDGEREIARLAFASGASVIALKNMGFSPLYKPGGNLFERASNGRLLLLSPIAWPYSPGEKAVTRTDACVLNRIAQLIAGLGAVEIDYKGMKPNDIDSRMREAVTLKNEKTKGNKTMASLFVEKSS